MESSLHRQLKDCYADGVGRVEVPLDGYRIDVVCGDLLVEIQHGSFSAIRRKIDRLVTKHQLLVVKPIIAQKTLVHLAAKGGRVVRRRRSPKKGTVLDVFDELIYLTGIYPHEQLAVEVALVEVEERRYPRDRRRRWGRRPFQVEDRTLVRLIETHRFSSAADLLRMLPRRLPQPFDTGDLAKRMAIERWVAQRIAYCLRKAGAVRQVGKRGNTLLYERAA